MITRQGWYTPSWHAHASEAHHSVHLGSSIGTFHSQRPGPGCSEDLPELKIIIITGPQGQGTPHTAVQTGTTRHYHNCILLSLVLMWDGLVGGQGRKGVVPYCTGGNTELAG